MMSIDTHTHLFTEEFDDDREAMVQKAIDAGVSKMLLPNIDLTSISALHQLCSAFPKNCFQMMGLHPCSVKESWEEDLVVIKSHLDKNIYCAIGEIGMDLYWDKTTLEIQKKAFAQQIEWAKEKAIPIVIHVRDAFEETFDIVDQLNDDSLTGVFHCFTGSIEQANHILSYGGFKLGLGGVLTFKNSGLDKVIEHVDLEHLVLETDSPYLAPVPYRGKRNESSYIPLIAQKLAEVKGASISEIANVTSKNAESVFPGIGK